jgi:hypothetical protein
MPSQPGSNQGTACGRPAARRGFAALGLAVACLFAVIAGPAAAEAAPRQWLDWQPLPPLPDPIGVAGPFVGSHRGGLIVAGGANFAAAEAADLWEVPKQFHQVAFVLAPAAGEASGFAWQTGFALERPLAYGACASTPAGIVCAGGDDSSEVSAGNRCRRCRAGRGPTRSSRPSTTALPSVST